MSPSWGLIGSKVGYFLRREEHKFADLTLLIITSSFLSMAPQKTMAVSHQEQALKTTNTRSANEQTAAKPRKRKGKQSQNYNQNQATSAVVDAAPAKTVPLKQINSSSNNNNNINNSSVNNNNGKSGEIKTADKAVQQLETVSPKAATRAPATVTNTNGGKQSSNQVPTKQQQQQQLKSFKEPLVSVPNQVSSLIVAKQLSTEEPDDIDAGIELDGSSNSGSSVKDINEDRSKSASVSPIMAQTNVVEKKKSSGAPKHAVELAPVEQMAGSLCSEISPSSKKANTTMQKLAANQQVIDADEQQLQQKLKSKLRKSSLKGSLSTSVSANISSASNASSNNIVASPQSPALCKICDQHVYQMERIMAEKAIYHKSCFRCHQCKLQLRMDNYSSHEGQVYCKAHHRQLFQPQVKLDNEDDVDIVAKSSKYTKSDCMG